jgi:transcriptional regulator with GAF, ATPase, and Fis domain
VNPLLCLAAMFEADFSIDWLEELTGMKASEILSDLEEQLQQQVLARRRPGIYFFCNAHKRQEWLNQLSPDERERYRLRIASVLIRELPDDDSKAIEVSRHLLWITNDWKGCEWLISAAEVCVRQGKLEMAVACFEKVLSDLSNTTGEEENRLFVKAAVGYSNSAATRSNLSAMSSWLIEARERVKKTENQPYEVLVEMHLAKCEWLGGHFDSSLKRFTNAQSRVEALDDKELSTSAATFSTYFLFWQGRFNDVIKIYEKFVPDVERYPIGDLSIIATMMVGHAYAMVGRLTQGLGLLSTIRDYCLQTGDRYMAAYAESIIGMGLLSVNHPDDAFHYLQSSLKEAKGSNNKAAELVATLLLAFFHFAKGDKPQCLQHLTSFVKHRRESQYSNSMLPIYLTQLCLSIQLGELPPVSGLSLENELARMTDIKNIFIKGLIYRYQALLGKTQGWPNEKITRSLALSAKWLEESGSNVELAKTQLELTRHYLSSGNETKGKKTLQTACDALSSIGTELIPDDLRTLIKGDSGKKDFLGDIVGLAKEMIKAHDKRKLVQQIMMVVSRITGAERGALLLLNGATDAPQFQLRASRNFTEEQIDHPSFAPYKEFIEGVIRSGKGSILGIGSEDSSSPSQGNVRSAICVPLILDGKTIGVLYHDNRLLRNVFKESDLDLLSYFAALAVLDIDGARAYQEIQQMHQRQKEEEFIQETMGSQQSMIEGVIGASPAMQRIWSQVDEVAKTDTTVLLLGETGTGKNLVAGIIHRQSARRNGPFITVQCSALTESLITSELFGHEKGAFTGATNRRIGRFEMADKGTLFLDEIGDLSLEVQARLLRVLQTREFERVGGGRDILKSDFRLIAATNRDLVKDIDEKRFREDLYYRINVYPITVPPIRERREDIPLLIHHFLKVFSTKYGKSLKIRQEVMEQFIRYDWPGNVREIENAVQRGVISSRGGFFRLPSLGTAHTHDAQAQGFKTLEENERQHIVEALRRSRWKIHGPGGAAEILDINPSTLASRIKKLEIEKPRRRSAPDSP